MLSLVNKCEFGNISLVYPKNSIVNNASSFYKYSYDNLDTVNKFQNYSLKFSSIVNPRLDLSLNVSDYHNNIIFTSIKKTVKIKINGHGLYRLAYYSRAKKVLITDYRDSSIKVIKLNGTLVKTLKLNKWLTDPFALCTTQQKEILVGCWHNNQGIIVFDNHFNIKKRLNASKLEYPRYITYDELTQNLFISDFNNSITIINIHDNNLTKTINCVTKPRSIQINNNFVFICGETKWEKDYTTQKITILNENNFIFKINKNDLGDIKRIEIENWLAPDGLQFDNSGNLLTTAFKLNEHKQLESKSRYLFILNEYGTLLNTIYLYDIDHFKDMLLIQAKLFILDYFNSIKIIELGF